MDLIPGLVPGLRWPLLGLLATAVVIGLLVWWSRRPVAEAHDDQVLVARSDRWRTLPRFRALRRRRLWRTGVQTTALLVLVGGCLLLLARPADVRADDTRPNRDVILCLDASKSMDPYNLGILQAVRRLVGELPGDRVGLTLFNGATVVKFPLTDDRAYVDAELARAEDAFAKGSDFYTRATLDIRASQLGDALVGCARGFDLLDQDRGRVILVASDNQPIGPPVHTLAEAADAALERDVVVHGLAVPALAERPRAELELRTALERTGGSLAALDDEDSVPEVVTRIDRLERRRIEEPPREVLEEAPGTGAALAGAGLLGLLALGLGRRP